jgi:hypothetical protein
MEIEEEKEDFKFNSTRRPVIEIPPTDLRKRLVAKHKTRSDEIAKWSRHLCTFKYSSVLCIVACVSLILTVYRLRRD